MDFQIKKLEIIPEMGGVKEDSINIGFTRLKLYLGYNYRMNSIKWTPKAAKQLLKLDQQFKRSIRDAVDTLVLMPKCGNVKALSNHDCGYRLRVGNFRVLFDWSNEIKIVEIQEVRKRDERTY